MSSLSKNEEDYLKALFHLGSTDSKSEVESKALAEYLQISAASVSSMLKKLKEKSLVEYEPYGKIVLSDRGRTAAIAMIRKHRLWETFLHQHMHFSWDEVHEVAEQLEHIRSTKLTQELDRFLGYPKTDPHGDPIPDNKGDIPEQVKCVLTEVPQGTCCKLVSVDDGSVSFLRYLTDIGLALSSEIQVKEHREFDGSLSIRYDGRTENVSRQFAEKVFVEIIG